MCGGEEATLEKAQKGFTLPGCKADLSLPDATKNILIKSTALLRACSVCGLHLAVCLQVKKASVSWRVTGKKKWSFFVADDKHNV